MKTVGIIAEFNPFHNGHQYLIEEAKRITGADYCVVVMSGDFVQRGGPAITDKHTRTHMALLGGADLVLELPVCYATGSAEFFAHGAVSLLDKIGVTDCLVFGSESGSLQPLMETARLLASEVPAYQSLLRNHLKSGIPFPAARQKALASLSPENKFSSPLPLESPNNILGVEYCKSLLLRDSSILPLTVARKGSSFHDTKLPEDSFCSASAIREHLNTPQSLALLDPFVPSDILSLLASSSAGHMPIQENDFSLLLHYKLLQDAGSGYAEYLDVGKDLSHKIKKYLFTFQDFRSFAYSLKSKNLTFSRISRCLLHILLDISNDHMALCKDHDYILYARLLGFRRTAGELLHAIKQNSSVPLLSKLADASPLLSQTGHAMLQKDLYAAHVYNMVHAAKYQLSPIHEYTKPVFLF